MPAVWFALKKSLHCQSGPADVHDPNIQVKNLSKIVTKSKKSSTSAGGKSGCSRSLANLKDVIHGSKRHMEEKPSIMETTNATTNASPRSIGSSELLNPIAHEVILSNSNCELKITGFGSLQDGNGGGDEVVSSRFEGTLKPGTPGPHHHHHHHHRMPTRSPMTNRRNSHGSSRVGSRGLGSGFGTIIPTKGRASLDGDGHGIFSLACHKCGEQFVKWEALEFHHLSKHAVTELLEGDSSRKIVELIYKTSWSKSHPNSGGIERILKVHNMQRTLSEFEEHRESVKVKASKLQKKHPRCLADGNELLRFHGTLVECNLGLNGSSSLCQSSNCNVCQILRHGFSIKKTNNKNVGGPGVFTTSTSQRAFDALGANNSLLLRKALIVCRVIAGRVHKPMENIQELANQSGFDSLAGKVGIYSNIEELYLLNPKALLPCFVIICKPQI
ncbi:putative transcription factor C2H2 family [Helianthus annuus]|nr:putative transcription factor C2H2 family [Helianthus annuus]